MSLTKIIATLGPVTETEKSIEALIDEGVSVFRLNLKHNEIEWHKERMETIRRIGKRKGLMPGILIDVQGPELRIEATKKVFLECNDLLELDKDVVFFPDLEEVVRTLKNGQKIEIDDGRIELEVVKKKGKFMFKVLRGGELEGKKSVSAKDLSLGLKALTQLDKKQIKELSIFSPDYIAVSFVRNKRDILEVRKFLKEINLESSIVAKIETGMAVENLEEIIEEADGIMVARGDLGTALPLPEIPYWQKSIIAKTRERGKFVIVATQMLQSMIENPVPTRAEVSDIANAVYDGADAVMLSGETAQGKWPIFAVRVMRQTLEFTERKLFEEELSWDLKNWKAKDKRSMICKAGMDLYKEILKERRKDELAGFLILTETGKTAQIVSSLRPLVPIIALTPRKEVARRLSVHFGVVAFSWNLKRSGRVSINTLEQIVRDLHDKGIVKRDKLLIVLHGDYWGLPGQTSTLRILSTKK